MITILIPALAALALIHFGTIIDGKNWYLRAVYKVRILQRRKRMRPFDCVKCMSGWLALPWAYYTDATAHNNPYLLPGYMIGALALGAVLERLWTE